MAPSVVVHADSSMIELAKKLADNNSKVRASAFKELRSKVIGLGAEHTDPLEFMKMWKGLFYCMWMSDKLPVQQDLADRITAFLMQFESEKVALLYIKTFWKTMMREWNGIDHLRLNKYYFLCRKMLAYTGDFLSQRKYNVELLGEHSDMIIEEPLNMAIGKSPLGIVYLISEHYLHVYGGNNGLNPDMLTKIDLLAPILTTIMTCTEKKVMEKISTCIFDPILGEGSEDEAEYAWKEEEILQLGKTMLMIMDDESISDESAMRLSKFLKKIAQKFGGIEELLVKVNGPNALENDSVDQTEQPAEPTAPQVEEEQVKQIVGTKSKADKKKVRIQMDKKEVKTFKRTDPVKAISRQKNARKFEGTNVISMKKRKNAVKVISL